MKEQSVNKGCITWGWCKMERRCRHMSPGHDSSKACRLSGWETQDIMVSGQCFCALQSHKCAFYPSTHKQLPTPTIHTRSGMDGRSHLCDVLKTCLLSIKKLSILRTAFSTWWLFLFCHNGRVSSAISSAYYSFVVIIDEKLKKIPSFLFFSPSCLSSSALSAFRGALTTAFLLGTCLKGSRSMWCPLAIRHSCFLYALTSMDTFSTGTNFSF